MKNKITNLMLLIVFILLVTGLLLYKIIIVSNLPSVPTFWTIYGVIITVFLVSRIPYAYMYKDEHENIYSKKSYPSVSIIIAVKNEEDGIYRTIETCLNSDYKGSVECIVVNDGSTDNTQNEIIRAQEFYSRKIRSIVFPVNKGKREAMAAGIKIAKNEIIVFVDSDSFLSRNALMHITEHFMEDLNVGAVSGNTKVENLEVNLLTKMQSIQYAISFDLYKSGQGVHSAVNCCPGCFSAYRKSSILPIINDWRNKKFLGKKGTFGDDRSLTNFVLKKWKVAYCRSAIATTVVPENFNKYFKQQLRWKKSWVREGLIASTFMWKVTHPFASLAFYINFTFPILGPILAATILYKSVVSNNPMLFIVFIIGIITLGLVFSLFVRLHVNADKWKYVPLVSFLFITVFMWQMPYALFTLNKTHWGTR